MTRLTVETDSAVNAKKLADFLKTIGYIKSVNLNKVPVKPLRGNDWIKPGRPATDEEHEQLCVEMENEGGGIDSKTFFKELKKKLKK